ncbi:MAG: SsrA-binding protein SmpB [Proteobacteria bacterium]|nr:SsrA-binding protein SmpB [Pseudomonadota bacterium]
MNKQSKTSERLIASNKKAYHDYIIEDRFEAGMVLAGWEVKSLRAGRVQLKESYVILKHGEAWLIGAHISPLLSASSHINPDPVRTRKLLLHERELAKLHKAKEREGYTVVALDLHWSGKFVKAEIALAKGKKTHDKRAATKEREWNREKQRLLRHH